MKSALLKLHAAVFLWGFTGVLGRLITLNEGLLVWYRIALTVVSLFCWLYYKGQLQKVSFKRLLHLFGIGGIIALHWVCFYGSIKYANVSIALICLSSAGLMAAIMEPIFNKKRIDSEEVALGVIAVIGIYLVFHFDLRYRTGIIIGMLATFLSVLFSILNKKQVNHIAPKTLMLYELVGGWLVLTALMPVYLHYFPTVHSVPSMGEWGWLLLLSWFCTILAMDLSLQALKHISAFTQNLTLNLEPVYGIILAFVVYREDQYLNNSFYAGFALILLAVVLQMWRIMRLRKA